MPSYRALIHASEILTGAGIAAKDGRRPREQDLGRIEDGAVIYSTQKKGGKELPHRIEWVGPTKEIPKKFARVSRRDLKKKYSVIPGLIDCHTHLIFSGDRSEEFAARCAGATYQEIANKGGGILSTVRATRAASVEELEKLALVRLKEAYAYGVRTLEIKSGYGLSTDSELKCLEVVTRLRKKFPEMTLTATFLGAHAVPPEMTRKDYMNELVQKMLPAVAKKKLADACDIFIDEGYFTLEDGRALLARAKTLGMKVKIHADELTNTESAALAAELGALSADHLLKISDHGIARLAASDTVAVLLPGTAFYLKAAYAPARKLIEAGAAVAISTDFNPGTCMTLHLPSILTLSALYLGMTRAEIFAGVTYNAAKALGLQSKKGSLEKGKDADFAVLPFSKFEEIYYRFAWALPERLPQG